VDKKPLAIKKPLINLTFWHVAKKLLSNEWIASYSKEIKSSIILFGRI